MTDKELKELAILKQKVDRLEKITLILFNITDSVITKNEFWFMNDDIKRMLRELKGE